MGKIVGAAIVAHHPGMFWTEEQRLMKGDGRDTDLLEGFRRVRLRMDDVKPDTLLILDTHWFSTSRFVLAGASHYSGVYTSKEMPWILSDIPYDYCGAPSLSAEIAKVAIERGVLAENATNAHIAPDYATVNLLGPLWRGERVLSASICQNARGQHFLKMGAAIAEAISRSDARVVILASGALSHKMVDMDFEPPNPHYWSSDNISVPAHVKLDHEIMALMAIGDHKTIIHRYPELRAASMEGLGGHYMQMVGALGGENCRIRGERLSDYENALGTGNVHIWFETIAKKEIE